MMDNEEFLSLLWRLEEMLMHVDYLRNQIGKCPDKCESTDAVDDEACVRLAVSGLQKLRLEKKDLARIRNSMRSRIS